MSALRKVKRALLATDGFGTAKLIARSKWRQRRLMILCYHGVSMGQEHGSYPEMFMQPAVFARRMEILAQSKCRVLDLGEALRLLEQGKLPPRSVALTFDDGWADFRVNAFPVLRKYQFPATVYLTTYYCLFNRPLFRFALAHMMWTLRDKVIDNHEFPWLPLQLDLRSEANRIQIMGDIDGYARQEELPGKDKDELAAKFAATLGFDYSSFCRERLFQLMTPAEVAEVARAGIDIQLHSHRHRTPLNRERFIDEIELNRKLINEIAGPAERVHFCYPSGAVRDEYIPWLREAGVQSGTTCDNGMASRDTDRFRLPRLLDQYALIEDEFESWLSGLAVFLPKRKNVFPDIAPE